MDFLRARQPEQKEERRAHLMSTAREMLDSGVGLGDLSLNELARRAEMTKSNVYRYFESREAVLLALLVDEWSGWFEDLKSSWPLGDTPSDELADVVGRLSHALVSRPRLGLLTSALPSVLEQNLGVDAIREFKIHSRTVFGEVADFIVARAPSLPRDAILQLLSDAIAILVGLFPLAHPAPAADRAMRSPELAGMKRDYAADLERFLGAIARDLVLRVGSRPA